MSSNQPRDLSALIAKHRPQHVVVHLYTSAEIIDPTWTIDQAASARAHGCTVGGYMFCYPRTNPEAVVPSALAIAKRAGIDPLPVLWLDVEEYGGETVDATWIGRAVAAAEAAGQRVGIYAARGNWPGGTAFAHLPLWDASWDGKATLDGFTGWGGWTERLGHQYADLPVDLSVFDASVAA